MDKDQATWSATLSSLHIHTHLAYNWLTGDIHCLHFLALN